MSVSVTRRPQTGWPRGLSATKHTLLALVHVRWPNLGGQDDVVVVRLRPRYEEGLALVAVAEAERGPLVDPT